MSRSARVALAVFLAVAVLFDPYTFNRDGSDLILPAPAWQLMLGLTDVLLLLGVAVLVWRRSSLRAFHLLFGEILFALAAGIILVVRDGVHRFQHGFGAEEYASLYLGSVAVRVGVLWLLRPTAGEPIASAEVSHR